MIEEIQQLIQTSKHRGLSHNEEKIILDYLNSINEEEVVEFLKYMVDQNSLISTAIAKRILRSKTHVKSFFEYGVTNYNSQPIKKWLEFVIPRLGFKSTVILIERLNNENNRLIEKAVYWLPTFISKNDANSRNILNKLREKIKNIDG